MKTDIIKLTGRFNENERALEEAQKVAQYKRLSTKEALHLRLLTEEMMGMMRSITGETDGEFWIEDDKDVYELHLKVHTIMNTRKREKLLDTSTSGKNESAKGLMGRLRDVFDRAADEDVLMSAGPLSLPGPFEQGGPALMGWEWSMSEYQDALSKLVAQHDKAAGEIYVK